MKKPSKLKRAIKVLEIEVEELDQQIEKLQQISNGKVEIIAKLREIDSEKSNEKEVK